MNNCLVTKLNTVINNNNLYILGALIINRTSSEDDKGIILDCEDITLKIIEGDSVFLNNNSKEITVTGKVNIKTTIGVPCKIAICDVYKKLKYLELNATHYTWGVENINILSYCERLYYLKLWQKDNTIETSNFINFKNQTLTDVHIAVCNGNLSDFINLNNLENLEIVNGTIEGDISSLASKKYKNLTVYMTQVTGNINDYFAVQIQNGMTSSTIITSDRMKIVHNDGTIKTTKDISTYRFVLDSDNDNIYNLIDKDNVILNTYNIITKKWAHEA